MFIDICFGSLIAIKLLVGINLFRYACRRYASMEQRERQEKQEDDEMKIIGKKEKVGRFYSLVGFLLRWY